MIIYDDDQDDQDSSSRLRPKYGFNIILVAVIIRYVHALLSCNHTTLTIFSFLLQFYAQPQPNRNFRRTPTTHTIPRQCTQLEYTRRWPSNGSENGGTISARPANDATVYRARRVAIRTRPMAPPVGSSIPTRCTPPTTTIY